MLLIRSHKGTQGELFTWTVEAFHRMYNKTPSDVPMKNCLKYVSVWSPPFEPIQRSSRLARVVFDDSSSLGRGVWKQNKIISGHLPISHHSHYWRHSIVITVIQMWDTFIYSNLHLTYASFALRHFVYVFSFPDSLVFVSILHYFVSIFQCSSIVLQRAVS